ncbi:MAG: MBL fold metallo-hydrolase [Planctomycetaceae bacterium]|nr:MBL fold metallo-hydrolase [Planctomycetaceae bacterium]
MPRECLDYWFKKRLCGDLLIRWMIATLTWFALPGLSGPMCVVCFADQNWSEERSSTMSGVEDMQLLWSDETTEVHRWENTCNSYLIRSGAKGIVIDFGDGAIVAKARSIGVEQIDWVLLTSHHRERCQGLIESEQTTTKVIGPVKEREFFEQPVKFRQWHPNLGDAFSVYGASYLRPPRLPIALDRPMVNDEVLRWEGLEIRCLETPGNSPGGVTYFCEIGGQTWAFTGGVVHDGARMVNWFDSEWDYGFAKGIDTLIGSVEQLKKTQIDRVLPAYGPPIEQPLEVLAQYQQKLEAFRVRYVRGYPVFEMTNAERDPVSQPTEVLGLSRVSEHVYKLSDSQKGWNFAIIISDRGHGLILDCGLLPAETLEQLIVGMRQHLGLKQIDAFWISHMHGDHFLQGPLLRSRYGAQSWTLDRIVDPIENPRRYDYAALVSAYGDGFDGMPIDKAFRDGEVVEWEGYKIQVDWMPGQTEFGCSLWLEIDGQKMVFTGDNLFGNPADPLQDGHEAVVARNSCIIEEGYLHAANYLIDLDPDIVIGSHSFVMPNPRDFLLRYQAWAKDMIATYRSLLPDEDYEYLYDPYWVSAYPYRVELIDEQVQTVTIRVRNFRDRIQQHRIVLKTPPGIIAEPDELVGSVAANSREQFSVKLRRAQKIPQSEVGIVALDITLDGKHYGEWFDFLVR